MGGIRKCNSDIFSLSRRQKNRGKTNNPLTPPSLLSLLLSSFRVRVYYCFISFYFCNIARAKFKQVSINTIIVIDICNTNWIMTDGRRQQIHRTNSGLKSLAPSLNHLYMQISVNYSFTINFTKFQTSFAININYRSMYFLQH